MKISCKQFDLELKHAFSIAKFTRTSTPLLLLKIDYEGKTGYGEASMVPYMGENYVLIGDTDGKIYKAYNGDIFYHR